MNDPENTRSEKVSIFRSPESEAAYHLAYEAALRQWPVPYEKGFIPTRFRKTHVVASGPKGADPLVLFHGTGGGATIWYRNVGSFSQHYRFMRSILYTAAEVVNEKILDFSLNKTLS